MDLMEINSRQRNCCARTVVVLPSLDARRHSNYVRYMPGMSWRHIHSLAGWLVGSLEWPSIHPLRAATPANDALV